MKPSEIRELTEEEISLKLEELKREHLNLRFGQTTQQIESTAKVKMVRRDIARMHTIKKEKEKAKNG